MRDWDSYRERFVQDVLPIRLGGVSAKLARIQSASRHDEHNELVRNMLEDSEYLIEWTAPEAEIDVAGELVEIQVQLALWHLQWNSIWNDIERRNAVAARAGEWSERILDLSGLLDDETYEKYNIPRR